MKPAPFKLLRPHDLDSVCTALDEYGDDARLLAGGQSLIPTMNFRLSQPEVLVDLSLVERLDRIELENGVLGIGAMVRQRFAETNPIVLEEAPLIARALPFVGHIQNRNRGTVGGSVAHADPAAELPAVAMALDAQLHLVRRGGERTVAATDFIDGPFMTTIEAGEILVSLRVPRRPGTLAAVHEVARRHGDFAIAGIALSMELLDDNTTVASARVAAFGVMSHPVRLADVESLLAGQALGSDVIRAASRAATSTLDRVTNDDLASSDYRRDALGVLTARALVDVAHQGSTRRSSRS